LNAEVIRKHYHLLLELWTSVKLKTTPSVVGYRVQCCYIN